MECNIIQYVYIKGILPNNAGSTASWVKIWSFQSLGSYQIFGALKGLKEIYRALGLVRIRDVGADLKIKGLGFRVQGDLKIKGFGACAAVSFVAFVLLLQSAECRVRSTFIG